MAVKYCVESMELMFVVRWRGNLFACENSQMDAIIENCLKVMCSNSFKYQAFSSMRIIRNNFNNFNNFFFRKNKQKLNSAHAKLITHVLEITYSFSSIQNSLNWMRHQIITHTHTHNFFSSQFAFSYVEGSSELFNTNYYSSFNFSFSWKMELRTNNNNNKQQFQICSTLKSQKPNQIQSK